MFSGQREFKALIFSSPSISTPHDITDLLNSNVDQDETSRLDPSQNSLEVYHCYYYTEKPYAALNLLEEVLVSFRGERAYKYDFYIALWKPKRRTHIVIATPFSSMAVDIFKILDTEIKGRKYKRLNLEGLIDVLQHNSNNIPNLVTTQIRFRVSGGDTVKSSQISGTDVLNSQYFRRISKTLSGIKLKPRRMRVKFDDGHESLSLEADKHGNYSFRLRKEGSNFPILSKVLSLLESAKLLEDTPAYPMRPGIIGEEVDE